MITILNIILILAVAKSLLIGSDFSFHYWLRDGKEYTQWYFNRETYKEYVFENEKFEKELSKK